ncbi:MAG: hypothetical protein ABJA02_02385 [Acidobacteriota bacterium]
MPDLLIKDIDQSVIDKLTMQATLDERTLEQVIHKVIREAAGREPISELESIRRLRNPKFSKPQTEQD